MNVDELLDQIDDLLEDGWSLPLSKGKCMVDSERVREILDDIKMNLPQEIKHARAIVCDRQDIIQDAKKEAEAIIKKAEDRARAMIASDEITRQAQSKANEILSNAQAKSRELRNVSADYVDDLMKRSEEALAVNLQEIRKARQNLKRPRNQSSADNSHSQSND